MIQINSVNSTGRPRHSRNLRKIFPTIVAAIALSFFVCPGNTYSLAAMPRQERLFFAQKNGGETSFLVEPSCSTADLIIALQQSTLKHQRRYAAELLGDRGSEAVPALLKALEDPEEVVEKAAADSLAKLNDKSIFPDLVGKLSSPDPQVRQYSAYVLGRIAKKEDKGVVDALEKVSADQDKNARAEVIYALCSIGSPSSKNIFINSLNDPEPKARGYAAVGLGKLKDPEGGKALAGALGREKDENVLRMMISAVGKIGRAGSVQTLIDALSNDIPSLKIDVADALGEIKTPDSTAALISMLSDRDSKVRERVAIALRDRKDPMAVRALADSLKDRSTTVRRAASEALISLADISVTKELTEALGDPDSAVAANATRALTELNSLDSVNDLISALDSPNRSQVEHAATVLGEITHREFGTDAEKWKKWYEENFKTTE